MPRRPLVPSADLPYSVSARCINKEWFGLPLRVVWDIMGDHLHFVSHAFNVRILQFVLMNNHFHLIVRSPDQNLSEAMRWLMGESSRSINRELNRINQTWGARYYRSLINSNHHFLNAYKYVYRNPVAANICSTVESFPFSSLSALLGQTRVPFPIEEDLTLFSDVEGTIRWLNQPPPQAHWDAVRKALRKKKFKLCKVNGKPHLLETEVL